MNRVTTVKPRQQHSQKPKGHCQGAGGAGQPILVFECAGGRDSPYIIQAICTKVHGKGLVKLWYEGLVSLMEVTNRPRTPPKEMAQDEVVDDGDNRLFGPRRSRRWSKLSHVITSQQQGISSLVT